jgi:hypothetical protein
MLSELERKILKENLQEFPECTHLYFSKSYLRKRKALDNSDDHFCNKIKVAESLVGPETYSKILIGYTMYKHDSYEWKKKYFDDLIDVYLSDKINNEV